MFPQAAWRISKASNRQRHQSDWYARISRSTKFKRYSVLWQESIRFHGTLGKWATGKWNQTKRVSCQISGGQELKAYRQYVVVDNETGIIIFRTGRLWWALLKFHIGEWSQNRICITAGILRHTKRLKRTKFNWSFGHI